MIEVPQKVWRPKFQNRYIPPYYANDIDKGVFDFNQYKKSVYIPQQSWEEVIHTNLITFDDDKHV